MFVLKFDVRINYFSLTFMHNAAASLCCVHLNQVKVEILTCVTIYNCFSCNRSYSTAFILTSGATVESSKMAKMEWSTQDCASKSTPPTSLLLRTNCRHTQKSDCHGASASSCRARCSLRACFHLLLLYNTELLGGCDQKLRNMNTTGLKSAIFPAWTGRTSSSHSVLGTDKF